MKLSNDFYQRDDVLQVSQDLLGKQLLTCIDGKVTGGVIVETEAYKAPEDKASHAFGNKRTSRTETFYKAGGVSYVYMCYGIHFLFNIITNKVDVPHAVLVRAIEPIEGLDIMMERRKKKKLDYTLTAGPGALSQALGITKSHNNLSLQGDAIWIEDQGKVVDANDITARPRVGIAYAEEYALKPWRFSISGNKWVSKAK
ncbi:DNA-3-methyladenine glycosylase [Cytophagaceae bacterium ABcell3]|nr:DNA-3-methyladenine glycosylase [Cytophagaceae bacterium ABcell3]